jgi:SPW repeat
LRLRSEQAISLLIVGSLLQVLVSIGLGIWLMCAPWLLGFAGVVPATWTHVLIGAIIAATAAFGLWSACVVFLARKDGGTLGKS